MFLGCNYLVGLIHNQVSHGLQANHCKMLLLEDSHSKITHSFLHSYDLVDLGFVIGKVNKNPQIYIRGIYGIKAIHNQKVNFTEIGNKFIDLFGYQINAGNHTFLFLLEIPDCLLDLDPVIFIQPDLIKSFISAPLLAQEGLDLVIVIGMNNFNPNVVFF